MKSVQISVNKTEFIAKADADVDKISIFKNKLIERSLKSIWILSSLKKNNKTLSHAKADD